MVLISQKRTIKLNWPCDVENYFYQGLWSARISVVERVASALLRVDLESCSVSLKTSLETGCPFDCSVVVAFFAKRQFYKDLVEIESGFPKRLVHLLQGLALLPVFDVPHWHDLVTLKTGLEAEAKIQRRIRLIFDDRRYAENNVILSSSTFDGITYGATPKSFLRIDLIRILS